MLSETTDSIADTPIPCGNTSDCRSMPTLPGDAFCKNGYCMCPKVDIGTQACSSINASMHENKISGDTIGKRRLEYIIGVLVSYLPNFRNKMTVSVRLFSFRSAGPSNV